MKSFLLASSSLFVIVLIGCSSAPESGTSSDADGTSPTGTTPSGFCAKKCISEDRDKCLAFAGRFSDAFLEAFETCGDNPGCIEPKLDAAPKTARQEKLADDFCAKCECDSAKFFDEGEAGSTLLSFSDARLDAVEEKCFPRLKSGLTCGLSFGTCVIDFLKEDLGASVVCRARR